MRQALGKGLDALIPKAAAAPVAATAHKVPLSKIKPNHLQPRKSFDPESLSQLAYSIKEHGLAQPILVSFDSATDSYELIAGERRLRATELAGLKEIDVIVKNPGSEKERLALALIENLQRENLSPMDEALGYTRLMKEASLNQTELGQFVGKSKSTISNTLRLLDLPENIQKALQFGRLTEGHARAILSVTNSIEKQRIFSAILEQGLSVRDSEDLARKLSGKTAFGDGNEREGRNPKREKSPDVKSLETSLQHKLGTKVDIRTSKNPSRGRITIHYYSLPEFEKIVNILNI